MIALYAAFLKRIYEYGREQVAAKGVSVNLNKRIQKRVLLLYDNICNILKVIPFLCFLKDPSGN